MAARAEDVSPSARSICGAPPPRWASVWPHILSCGFFFGWDAARRHHIDKTAFRDGRRLEGLGPRGSSGQPCRSAVAARPLSRHVAGAENGEAVIRRRPAQGCGPVTALWRQGVPAPRSFAAPLVDNRQRLWLGRGRKAADAPWFHDARFGLPGSTDAKPRSCFPFFPLHGPWRRVVLCA